MWRGLLVASVVLIGLAIATVGYIVPRIRIHDQPSASGDHVRVETPFGSVRVDERKDMKVDVGDVPIYPGAKLEKKDHGGAMVDIDWGGGEKMISVAAAEYVTSDSVSKVRHWYRNQLPDWKVSDREMIHIERGLKRIITIKERDGRTRIGIATVGEPATN